MLKRVVWTATLVMVAMLSACASKNPPTGESLDVLIREAEETVAMFKEKQPRTRRFFDEAYGYAVYPLVAKGAMGVGGANGRGLVYEQGKLVGYTTVTQATIGFQLGGQGYRELVFFQDKIDLDHFKQGNIEFDAQASAVAANAGVSADADYSKGVAIFTMERGGLMYEASLGGQGFSYRPLETTDNKD